MHHIQFDGDEVVKAKDDSRNATLSMAYAGVKFANAVLCALNGEKDVVTESLLFRDHGIDFSSNVELGVYFHCGCRLTFGSQ